MSSQFKPANSFAERHGLFVALAGGTNSGKTFSALRLARGIAGPKGRIAAVDTEGGRLLHLKKDFDFDVMMMDPPHRPNRYADAARDAEAAGYDCLLIDSFSMEWVGLGGVLDWQAEEYERMGAKESIKLASWIKPKVGHKAMVYSFLQRRIPIIFSLRAEEKAKKDGNNVKSEWAPICNRAFPFEVTVSFMLMQNRQGVIDLSLQHKMEGSHRTIFRDGEQLSERHGEMLAAWAMGEMPASVGGSTAAPHGSRGDPFAEALAEARQGREALMAWWNNRLGGKALIDVGDGRMENKRDIIRDRLPELQAIAASAESSGAETKDEDPFNLPPIDKGSSEPDEWRDRLRELMAGAAACKNAAALTAYIEDNVQPIGEMMEKRPDLASEWAAFIDQKAAA